MEIKKEVFGKTGKGEEAYIYTLRNKKGMEARITNFGAILVSLLVPNKDGEFADVVLGYDRLEDYFDNPSFLGATVGRNANRIAGAAFELNQTRYELDKNDGENNLHTHREIGMHKQLWMAKTDEEENALHLTYTSPDGEAGFPGNLEAEVTYVLTEDDAIEIHYHGVSDKDTVINMTNHSYFNLAGHDAGQILDHKLMIQALAYTPVVPGAIPTGELAAVEGTAMDFCSLKRIGDEIDSDWDQLTMVGGYDHNWVLDHKAGELNKIALVVDEAAGRVMEVYSDLPGVQFYAGNGLNGLPGKGGASYGKRAGLCLETQYYPNAVNEKDFPSPVYQAGQVYQTTTIYKFV